MDGETRKDLIQASKLHSEYYSSIVKHYGSYSDARGVTFLHRIVESKDSNTFLV
jgi:hypothetical protein